MRDCAFCGARPFVKTVRRKNFAASLEGHVLAAHGDKPCAVALGTQFACRAGPAPIAPIVLRRVIAPIACVRLLTDEVDEGRTAKFV